MEDGEAVAFLNNSTYKKHGEKLNRSSQRRVILPWVLTIILGALSLFQFIHSERIPKHSYETGFETDFDEARGHIKLERRRFTHAIRLGDNGTLYEVLDHSKPIYTGPPSPEIDAAWDELTGKRYFKFTQDEVDVLKEDQFANMERIERLDADVRQPGYYGGVDFLHSLHCLNAIRKHLDLKYYEPTMDLPIQYRQMHIYHCIDQLRQLILCHGDTTPVTLLPIWQDQYEQGLLGQTERLHTCRDGEELRRWTLERGKRTGVLDR